MSYSKQVAVFMVLAAAGFVRADVLTVSLMDSSLSGAPGSTLAFFATISNPSGTDTVYLNGDDSSTVSAFLTVDDMPFNLNAPLFLGPDDNTGSVPFELFDVIIDPATPPGAYLGNDFSILGGPDGGTDSDFGDLADVSFDVTVTAAASPEPATFWMAASMIVVAALKRVVPGRSDPSR